MPAGQFGMNSPLRTRPPPVGVAARGTPGNSPDLLLQFITLLFPEIFGLQFWLALFCATKPAGREKVGILDRKIGASPGRKAAKTAAPAPTTAATTPMIFDIFIG